MRAGRAFLDTDTTASRTAIANESLVQRLFSGQNPIGSRVWIGETPYDIVGVVADYSSNPVHRQLEPRLFVPLSESADVRRMHFVIRADGDPTLLVPAVRRAIPAALTGTAVTHVYTFDQILRVVRQEILLGSAPLFPLVAIGLLLTAAGIYGVLAFAIERRSREFAVRVAVGARRADLIRLVSAHAGRLVASGLALGLGSMFGLSRIVRASGGAGSFMDPAPYVFLVPIVVVLGIGVIATWLPSRRAAKIDPAVLLRTS
jgi:putative ABC transport system permease protein